MSIIVYRFILDHQYNHVEIHFTRIDKSILLAELLNLKSYIL